MIGTDDEGDSGERFVGVGAQAAGDGAAASAVEQAAGGVPQHRHDGRPGPEVDQAAILAERDILDVVQPILDPPVATLERQEVGGGRRLGRQAGDGVVQGAVRLPVLAPSALQPDDLRQARPGAVAGEVGGGDEMARVVGAPMALLDGARLAQVERRQGRGNPGGGSKSRRMSSCRVGWFSFTRSR